MSSEDIRGELERLRKENERLKQGVRTDIRVSPKGAVSVYGLQRFPITLYKNQIPVSYTHLTLPTKRIV